MTKRGRPRVLDEAKRREICALVSAGTGIATAAKYVGCSKSTIYREAKLDEEFAKRLQRAKAMVCLTPLQALRRAVQEDWRAAAWMLERTNPEEFGRSYRNAFGRRELNALARDLLTILRDEIGNPVDRDQAIERMRATINYAMRHAWDQRRTGGSLDRAMRTFEKMSSKRNDETEFDFDRDFSSPKQLKPPAPNETFATPGEPEFRKVEAIETLLDALSTRITGPPDQDAA